MNLFFSQEFQGLQLLREGMKRKTLMDFSIMASTFQLVYKVSKLFFESVF